MDRAGHIGVHALWPAVGLFTLIYKWLPSGGVPWRYALIGGAVIALLFAAGNRALVYYFEVTQLTSGLRRHGGLRCHHGVDVLDGARHPARRPDRPLDARRADQTSADGRWWRGIYSAFIRARRAAAPGAKRRRAWRLWPKAKAPGPHRAEKTTLLKHSG
jgi:hypothetical protein